MRVHGPLAIMVLSYLLPPAQAVPPHFCQAAVRMYPKNLCKAGGHGQEGMERYESSKYLLTIPHPVCILRIMNNVHVEVIG